MRPSIHTALEFPVPTHHIWLIFAPFFPPPGTWSPQCFSLTQVYKNPNVYGGVSVNCRPCGVNKYWYAMAADYDGEPRCGGRGKVANLFYPRSPSFDVSHAMQAKSYWAPTRPEGRPTWKGKDLLSTNGGTGWGTSNEIYFDNSAYTYNPDILGTFLVSALLLAASADHCLIVD